MKRKLDKKEKEIYTKRLIDYNKELINNKWLFNKAKLYLDEGIEQEFLKMRKEYEKNKRVAETNVNVLEKEIKRMTKEYKEGVEIKKKQRPIYHDILGYNITEDNTITELCLPTDVIKLLQVVVDEFNKAEEGVKNKTIKEEKKK